jgi:REP element-mobilizing transposase RayT
LDEQERDIVRDAIVALAEARHWELSAVHVRSNHVHVVVSNPGRDSGRIMSDMKAAASKELTRAGFDDAHRKRWTRHGSTRRLFDGDAVEAAVRYTLDEQGTPMSTWSAEEPRTKEPRTK